MFERRRLERRLNAERPGPDEDLLRQWRARIDQDQYRVKSQSRFRLGVALAVAVASVVAAGMFGGLGYASDAVTGVSTSVGHTVGGVIGVSASRPSTSGSIAPDFLSAASTEYGGSGYYCFEKKTRGTTIDHNYFISSPHDFAARSNSGFVALSGPTPTPGPCPP